MTQIGVEKLMIVTVASGNCFNAYRKSIIALLNIIARKRCGLVTSVPTRILLYFISGKSTREPIAKRKNRIECTEYGRNFMQASFIALINAAAVRYAAAEK